MNTAWSDAAAIALGESILSQAVVDGGTATWWVPEAVKGSSPPRTEQALAGGGLYAGTAGVALFLAELAGVTGRDDFRRTARMALEHSLAHGPGAQEPIPSLHSGTVGILFAAASYLRHFDDPDLMERCETLLLGLDSDDVRDLSLDVIAGSAGGIPGLLTLSDVFDAALIECICTRLGEHLINVAQVEPSGLSWHSGAPKGGNLCGMAHGAAGYGLAFLELYVRTGRTCFRLAAEEAFAYENTWYDARERNWADLRNGALHRYFTEDRVDELRSLPGTGQPLPTYERKYMTAWCHGAPGIALSRARAYAVLGSERYRREALSAVPATRRSLRAPYLGHSICHGLAGNAEALLVVAGACRLPGLEAWVLRHVKTLMLEAMAGGRPLRSGRLGQLPDVSLMLGDAGIGLFLLGLRHRVVSASYPVLAEPRRAPLVRDAVSVRRRIAEGCFPHSTAALGPDRLDAMLPPEASPVPTVRPLETSLGASARRDPRLTQPFRLDSMLLARAREAPFDDSLSFLCRAFPPGTGPADEIVLAPWVEVIETDGGRALMFPGVRGRWTVRRVTDDIAALLRCLGTPRTMGAVADDLDRALEAGPVDLGAWVEEQVGILHGLGIVIPSDLALGLRAVADVRSGDDGASAARSAALR